MDEITRIKRILDKYGGEEKYKVWKIVKTTKTHHVLEDEYGNRKTKKL